MSFHILLLIFGKIYESFRDTWISDDFGIFWNVFRILDFNPGTYVSDIFKFQVRDNIFIYKSFSLFPFSFISFLPSQSKRNSIFQKFQKSKLLPTFSKTPHTSPLMPSFSLSSLAGHHWPRETPHSPLFAQKPPLFYLFAPPLQKSKPI